MDYYLLTARSITHAQQMARVLERNGINAAIRRTGGSLSQSGCGYMIRLSERQFRRAAALLREEGTRPVKAFGVSGGMRREVSL